MWDAFSVGGVILLSLLFALLYTWRKLVTLRRQIKSELILTKQLVGLASAILAKSKISSVDAFALKVGLFENEEAIKIAQNMFGDPDPLGPLASYPGPEETVTANGERQPQSHP
jgi:hypothetical protein